MTTTSWVEEGTLADMKHRLDKLRVCQSRQRTEDEPGKKDTLKILQSKFGSPVYDPTSPQQKAYDRSCARTGRRKSIEFEDLYLKKGSGLLQLPSFLGSPKSRSGSATPRKHHLVHGSSGVDYSMSTSHAGGQSSAGIRKSSDPSSYKRGGGDQTGQGKPRHEEAASPSGGQKVGQGEGEGQKGQSQKGILSVTVSEEERRVIDQKLAGMGRAEEGGSRHLVPPQRRRKISKTGAKH